MSMMPRDLPLMGGDIIIPKPLPQDQAEVIDLTKVVVRAEERVCGKQQLRLDKMIKINSGSYSLLIE